MMQGGQMRDAFIKQELDTVLDIDIVMAGFTQGIQGISSKENYKMIEEFFKDLSSQASKNEDAQKNALKQEGLDYLEANKLKTGVVTTPSGLQYEVITMGDGAKPLLTDKIKCHYNGSLIDGSVFDSSIKRGEPIVLSVTQVIPGWTEALQLMPVGSKWRLTIPSELAYGANPRPGPIKPYAVLIFDLELISIEQ